MALIILPKKGEPNAELEAKIKLKAAIDEPYTVVMIVSSDSPDIREVLEVCVARASVKPDIRRVVWVPDTRVLSAALRALYAPDDQVAVAVGLEDNIAASLDEEQGKTRLYVEQAFLAAEAQGTPHVNV